MVKTLVEAEPKNALSPSFVFFRYLDTVEKDDCHKNCQKCWAGGITLFSKFLGKGLQVAVQ